MTVQDIRARVARLDELAGGLAKETINWIKPATRQHATVRPHPRE
jgi:hypothetical protein